MAVTGVRVKVHNLFEANSSPEYLGVTSITFSSGFDTMTLTGSVSGTNVVPASGQVISILNSAHIEILRATTEFGGGGGGTPAG